MEVVDRLAVFPTFSSQLSVKCRLTCARRGRDLLEKKVDGLSIRFRMILSRLLETKPQLGEVMKDTAFSLAEVNYVTGGINDLVLQSVDVANTRIQSRQEIIGGVRLRIYEPVRTGYDPFELAGLARGGQQVINKALLGTLLAAVGELTFLTCNFKFFLNIKKNMFKSNFDRY